MMVEPQRLEYNAEEDPAPSLVIYFQNYKTPIELPVQKVCIKNCYINYKFFVIRKVMKYHLVGYAPSQIYYIIILLFIFL